MSHRRIVAALVVLVLLLLLAPAAARALDFEKGVKAGVNLSNFHGSFDNLASISHVFSLTAGLGS